MWADLMQFTNGVLHWDLHIVWAIQDWELESLMTFMDTIYGLGIRGIGKDKMCWKPDKKKGFKIATYYRLLDAAAIANEQSFPWKIIWRSKAPPRVAFFVWTAALGKILTIDNLRKRKIRITDWCCMCNAMVNLLITYCFRSVVHDFGFVWSFMGDAKIYC